MEKSEIILFVNDTIILFKAKNVVSNIKSSNTEAISWFNGKKLCVNSKKIQLMYFGKNLGLGLKSILPECELQESVKFLFIALDRKLRFDFYSQQTLN